MVTVAVVVAAAMVSPVGRAFLGVMIVWNTTLGLLLTHDVREWPHRLQEVLPYCVYTCESASFGNWPAVNDVEKLRDPPPWSVGAVRFLLDLLASRSFESTMIWFSFSDLCATAAVGGPQFEFVYQTPGSRGFRPGGVDSAK